MNRFRALSLLLVVVSSCAQSAASGPQVTAADTQTAAVHQRYGNSLYLYAGESCSPASFEYVHIARAELFEGIHRLALVDSAGRYHASDVYFDEMAVSSLPDRRVLYDATASAPVVAEVRGWHADCGGFNLILLVDRMRLLP